MKKLIMPFLLLAFVVSGCATPQTKTGKGAAYGTAAGAAAGALAGQLIGGDTEATLWGTAIGAAVGGAAGAGAGKMMDQQEQAFRQELAASEAAAVRREGNLLSIVLQGDMTFDTDSAAIRSGLRSEVDRMAQVMQQYPQTRIRIEGYTDSTGAESYNQQLSERRAQSVKELLVQQGVSPARIDTIGFGESQPVATNATAEGRRLNRRVEIKIVPNEVMG